MMRKNDDLDFNDEFDQKSFQVRFCSEEKSCNDVVEINQQIRKIYNKTQESGNKERNHDFALIFLLTSEKGCFISRLTLY